MSESCAMPESERIEKLHQLGLLDTPRSEIFDSLARQALALVLGPTIAAISLVDVHRQWFKAMVGHDIVETPRSQSFCSHTIQESRVMVVPDATNDTRFANNPLVTQAPSIRSYAGVKLLHGAGALCVIGREPRHASETEIARLVKLAQYVDIQLLSHGTLFNLGAGQPPGTARAQSRGQHAPAGGRHA